MKKVFSEESLNATFEALNYEYEDMKQLMVDTALGVQGVSKKEAEEAIRNMMFSVLELDPANLDNKKLFKRAMKNNKNRLFEVIEDVVNGTRTTITTALVSTHYTIGFDEAHTKEDLNVILDFVQYLEYLEKWDGKLPTVVSGTDGVEIIIPNLGEESTKQ